MYVEGPLNKKAVPVATRSPGLCLPHKRRRSSPLPQKVKQTYLIYGDGASRLPSCPSRPLVKAPTEADEEKDDNVGLYV